MAKNDETIPFDDEPLTIEAAPSGPAGPAKIQMFGAKTGGAGKQDAQYKRSLNLTGAGATRCRFFHSKVTVAAIDFIVQQINEWLDQNHIEVKYVNQVVGIMEGKTPEPNVIITVWY